MSGPANKRFNGTGLRCLTIYYVGRSARYAQGRWKKSVKTFAIIGTSRKAGNTRMVVDALLKGQCTDIIDLSEVNISAYDYEHKNRGDGFISLIHRIIESDLTVLASPVYWYTLSTQMKMFIDRMSDCLGIDSETGRKLKGKNIYLIGSGSDEECPPSFYEPIEKTCNYMGMGYKGLLYCAFPYDLILTDSESAKIAKAQESIFQQVGGINSVSLRSTP